jgi:hypothetical protein
MRYVALILAVLMVLSVAPVQALDLSIPDSLHGTQVAGIDGAALAAWEQSLVTEAELNERMAYERDKTTDTIAITAWVLLAVYALTRNGSGKDGKDGKDGADGKPRPCVVF